MRGRAFRGLGLLLAVCVGAMLAAGGAAALTPIPSVPTKSNAKYVNPFADPGWIAGRTDMGVDWEPLHRLPVLAVGDAVILGSSNHSGWPGGRPYIETGWADRYGSPRAYPVTQKATRPTPAGRCRGSSPHSAHRSATHPASGRPRRWGSGAEGAWAAGLGAGRGGCGVLMGLAARDSTRVGAAAGC